MNRLRLTGVFPATAFPALATCSLMPRRVRRAYFAPGLFLIGVGLGVMLTPSVNVVQSAFPENLQGEISGLSRSVSNLGSSFGTAIAGTILVAGLADPSRSYGIAMIVLAFLGLIGLGATILLPAAEPAPGADIPAPAVEQRL